MTICFWGGPLNALSVWGKAVSWETGLQFLGELEPAFFKNRFSWINYH